MHIRRLEPPDRAALAALLAEDETFQQDELSVALELIDAAVAAPRGDYRVLVCVAADQLLGYVCYGPTPMTDRTFDLYWIVTHPSARGRGVATRLVGAMEETLRATKARLVRIETSQLEAYAAARLFYERLEFVEVGRITDFYRAGDDLIILSKRLDDEKTSRKGRHRAVSQPDDLEKRA